MKTQVRYEKIETKKKLPFRVINIQVANNVEYIENGLIEKHWHRSVEFVIPYENGTEVWVEGNYYHVYPDTMILINSREIHECHSINPSLPYKGYAIQLRYDFLSEVLPEIDNYQFDVFYERGSHPYLFTLMDKIIKMEQTDSIYKDIKLKSLAYNLIYELASHYCVDIQKNKMAVLTKYKSRMVDILSYLDRHASEPFDAQVVADQFHLSYGHLAKIFKNELGMSMKDYVDRVRIQNASIDLLSTDETIIDIASKHGFANSKAFYKEFEKVYHMTPKQYRKNER